MKNKQFISLEQTFNPQRNSLNFLRLSLAILVVFSHSYELGGYGIDPFKTLYKFTLGDIAVHGFFGLSGFLITASFINTSYVWHYLWKRVLRIFPGFWLCLFFTAFILCPSIYLIQNGSLDNVNNLLDNPFVNYVKENFWLKINQPNIGNLFMDHPAQGVVNGSLWSLFPEFLCYLLIAFLGKLNLLTGQGRKWLIMILCLLLVVNAYQGLILEQYHNTNVYGKVWYLLKLTNLLTYFISGVLLFSYKESIPFNTSIFVCLFLSLILSIIFGIYNVIGCLLLPYFLLCMAINLPFYKFHHYGDYSYGLYVYSYPIQQTIYFFNKMIPSQILFFIISLATTFPLAWLSWHLVEKRCLNLKKVRLFSKFSA